MKILNNKYYNLVAYMPLFNVIFIFFPFYKFGKVVYTF